MKDAWKNDPSARFVAKMAGGLLMGGPMGLAGAVANQARAGLGRRGDAPAPAANYGDPAEAAAVDAAIAAPTQSNIGEALGRAGIDMGGEGPDVGGLAGEVADWGGHAPGEDYGGFAGTGEYRYGGYTGEGR